MINDEKMTNASQHFARWLQTDDPRERDLGLDLFRQAVDGASVVEITKRLPAFVDATNAFLGRDTPREVH